MAVADLQKSQSARFDGSSLANDADRTRHATGDGPQDAGSGPGHAFEDFAPADAARLAVIRSHGNLPLSPRWVSKEQIADVEIYSCACGSAALAVRSNESELCVSPLTRVGDIAPLRGNAGIKRPLLRSGLRRGFAHQESHVTGEQDDHHCRYRSVGGSRECRRQPT